MPLDGTAASGSRVRPVHGPQDPNVVGRAAPAPGRRPRPAGKTIDRGSHLLWGHQQRLVIRERNGAPRVELYPRKLVLGVPPGTGPGRRRQLLEGWYRLELRRRAEGLLSHWGEMLGVRHQRLIVRAMHRSWGSCNAANGTIHLNTALVHAPAACLDYVVLHELCHLRLKGHGEAFEALLASQMADWRQRQRLLNSLPLASPPMAGSPQNSAARIGTNQVGVNRQQVAHRRDP
jgi:predicted metal-dependent hydrolase